MRMQNVMFYNFSIDIFYILIFFFTIIFKRRIIFKQKNIYIFLVVIFVISFLEGFINYNQHNLISGLLFDIFLIIYGIKFFLRSDKI
jgi:hypothetical protein